MSAAAISYARALRLLYALEGAPSPEALERILLDHGARLATCEGLGECWAREGEDGALLLQVCLEFPPGRQLYEAAALVGQLALCPPPDGPDYWQQVAAAADVGDAFARALLQG